MFGDSLLFCSISQFPYILLPLSRDNFAMANRGTVPVSLLLADSAAAVNYFVVVAVLAAKAKPFSEK